MTDKTPEQIAAEARVRKGCLWVAAVPVGLVLIAFVLALLGVGGGSDDDGPSDSYVACERAVSNQGVDPTSDDGLYAIGQCMERFENPETTEDRGSTSGELDERETCDRFLEIVSDVGMTDRESAVAFRRLASQVSNPQQAIAVDAVARAFDRSADEISSEPVLAFCR
jgi:hypothetical protein